MEDSFIINQLNDKNEFGVDIFIIKYGRVIRGVINKYLIKSYHKDEVDVVFYDVVFKVWNNIDCYDSSKGKFINFVISVAKYTSIDYLRKNKNRINLEYREEILTEEIHEDEYNIYNDRDEFEKLLIGLKDIDRDIFIRRYYLQQEIYQIANDLNLKEDYIYTRISRGKKKLKNLLGGEEGGGEGII